MDEFEKKYTSTNKQASTSLSLILILILMLASFYSQYPISSGSEKIEGTLNEVIYANVYQRHSFIHHRYYGIYDYYDDNGNLKQVKSTGFNLSEDNVPKTTTIYYNEKSNKAIVGPKLSWVINEFLMEIIVLVPIIAYLMIKKIVI